jgi:hypothetical protein
MNHTETYTRPKTLLRPEFFRNKRPADPSRKRLADPTWKPQPTSLSRDELRRLVVEILG